MWPKTLEETIEYFEEIIKQLPKNSSLFSEAQDVSNIECLHFYMRLLTYLKELKNIKERDIIKSDSKYYSKEIKKAARGIYQIYTQLLNAGFDSNIAIDIMIAMISVTKKGNDTEERNNENVG